MSEPRQTHEWERSPGGSIQWDLHPAEPEGWRGLPWLPIAIVALGFLMLGIGIARAAEPASQPHEITLFYAGKDYDAVSVTSRTISGHYESREACKVAIVRVRVMVSGARLACTPVEPFRTN